MAARKPKRPARRKGAVPSARTRDRQQRTPAAKRKAFIDELRQRGSVYHAALAAGIGRRTAYRWRDEEEAFARDWDDALEDAYDVLEASAYERAVEGVDEPVFHEGEICGYVRKYSDRLVPVLLNGRRPQVFKNRTELSGPNGGPIPHRDETPHAPLSEAELAEVAGIVAAARGGLAQSAGAEAVDPAQAVAEADRVPPAS